MLSVFTSVLVLWFLIGCSALQYKEQNEVDLNETIKCSEFFHGKPWPMPRYVKNRGVVQLCQTQKSRNKFGKPVFATLFSTSDRIPVYTANTVVLNTDAPEHDRPSSEFWHRIALPLCDENNLPTNPVASDLSHVDEAELATCRKHQAACDDYKYNGMDIDRGHLSPNSINSQDQEKQEGTFTLTNAAPQFAAFNRNSWRVYECVTMHTILKFVPGEKVYIVTGTYGTATDNNGDFLWMNKGDQKFNFHKNPVKVPAHYWKAVCYPGNKEKNKKAWGYAIVKENVNKEATADHESYITLKAFSQIFFHDPIFGPECINAPFGDFGTIFPDWENYVKDHCDPSKYSKKDEL